VRCWSLVEQARVLDGSARGGVLTPATGLGNVLVERLRQAGMVIEPKLVSSGAAAQTNPRDPLLSNPQSRTSPVGGAEITARLISQQPVFNGIYPNGIEKMRLSCTSSSDWMFVADQIPVSAMCLFRTGVER